MGEFKVVLGAGWGWGIIIGIGFLAAAIMWGISYIQNRYTVYSTHNSEEFNTASRSVQPGLIACAVVSSWTWAATLRKRLQSESKHST